jgi:hypothetical protein
MTEWREPGSLHSVINSNNLTLSVPDDVYSRTYVLCSLHIRFLAFIFRPHLDIVDNHFLKVTLYVELIATVAVIFIWK